MPDQGEKYLLIVSRSVSSNCAFKRDTIPSLVFLFDTLHVILSAGGDNTCESPLICPQLVDCQSKCLCKIFLRISQALYSGPQKSEVLIIWISFQILQKFIRQCFTQTIMDLKLRFYNAFFKCS